MTSAPPTLLTVGIGDIHGRFRRVQAWIETLEAALGRPADLLFAVGDVEAFEQEADHRRKATKRAMPAEFADFVGGRARMRRPLYFVGGNNEDFVALHRIPQGGELVGGAHYLGRAGTISLLGLRVAYLSGIYAPRHYDTPLREPAGRESWKQAGYFRRPEAEGLMEESDVDLLLLHEWPRGLVRRGPAGSAPPGPPLRAHRFPWVGNPVATQLVARMRPRWVWAGHSHVPLATTVVHGPSAVTRVACLDQAASPEGAVFWVEWRGREPVRAGWGIGGASAWVAGGPWREEQTPRPAEEPLASAQPLPEPT